MSVTLVSVDAQTRFKYKDYADGNQTKIMTLSCRVLRRYLAHTAKRIYAHSSLRVLLTPNRNLSSDDDMNNCPALKKGTRFIKVINTPTILAHSPTKAVVNE